MNSPKINTIDMHTKACSTSYKNRLEMIAKIDEMFETKVYPTGWESGMSKDPCYELRDFYRKNFAMDLYLHDKGKINSATYNKRVNFMEDAMDSIPELESTNVVYEADPSAESIISARERLLLEVLTTNTSPIPGGVNPVESARAIINTLHTERSVGYAGMDSPHGYPTGFLIDEGGDT